MMKFWLFLYFHWTNISEMDPSNALWEYCLWEKGEFLMIFHPRHVYKEIMGFIAEDCEFLA